MAIWVNVKGGRTPCTKERQQCMVRELHHLKHDGPLFVQRCLLNIIPIHGLSEYGIMLFIHSAKLIISCMHPLTHMEY